MYVCFGSSLDNNVLINIMLGGFQPESVEREKVSIAFKHFLEKILQLIRGNTVTPCLLPTHVRLKSGDKSKMPVFPVGRQVGNGILFSGHLVRENAL